MRPVHQVGETCTGCERKLDEADPLVAEAFRLIKKRFPDCHIAWAFRGQADQEKAFQDGASDLPWPRSRHNIMKDGKPCSEALDLFMLSHGIAIWPWKFYGEIARFIKQEGLPLDWGYDLWKKDGPHFQLKPQNRELSI